VKTRRRLPRTRRRRSLTGSTHALLARVLLPLLALETCRPRKGRVNPHTEEGEGPMMQDGTLGSSRAEQV
jgi:hypothetical protein